MKQSLLQGQDQYAQATGVYHILPVVGDEGQVNDKVVVLLEPR
jgi:hypothetical protein